MPGSYVRKTLKTRFSSRMAGTKMEAIHVPVHIALGTIRELYDRAIYALLGFAIGLLSFCGVHDTRKFQTPPSEGSALYTAPRQPPVRRASTF